MLSVALTGNVASGKTSVAELWARLGVPVVSADALARKAVEPGNSGLEEVRREFGEEVMAADGTLDREKLRAVVFDDGEARRRLEAVIHPRIWALREAWLEAQRARGESLVVSEIPLLFETGRENDFDAVVFVDAPERERLRRLVEDRGLASEQARRVMSAQMEPDAKRARATVVVSNVGNQRALRTAALEALAQLRIRAGTPVRMKMDLHLHTAGSWDCLSDPRRVLKQAWRRGIDRIAVTDHNRLDVALRMAEEYPEAVIPGEEVKTAEGIDVIGLYLTDEIPEGTPACEVVQRVRAQGGVSYLPHPYAAGKGGRGRYAEELAPLVDVVEVFNARMHPGKLNCAGRELARRHGRLGAAGSDAHTLREIGGATVDVPWHANRPEALLAALEDAEVEGRTASHLVHLASTWAKLRKKLAGAPGTGFDVPR